MTTTRAIRGSIGAGLAVLSIFAMTGRTEAGLIPGGPANKASSDCYLELDVDGVEAGTPTVQGSTVVCTDGEACDTGPCGDNVCVLHVAACINQRDPNLPSCTPPAGLDSAKIKGKFTVNVPQALTGSVCGGFLDATVTAKLNKKGKYLQGKSKLKLKGKAKAPKGTTPRTDGDTWVLQCAPRTSACPTSTTTTTSPTTTTMPLSSFLDFTVSAGTGSCGKVTSDVSGMTTIASLGCGGLNIGGGIAAAPAEGPTPDGSINRFGLTGCTANVCTIVPTTAAEVPAGTDCTDTGCPFGIPLPIKGSPDTCVLNSFATPASGAVDLAAGTVSNLGVNLSALIFGGSAYLANLGDGPLGQPCPLCVNNIDSFDTGYIPVSGSPSSPATGVCNGGPRVGLACTSQNSMGLTHDCKPGGNVPGSNPPRPCEPTEDCVDSRGQQMSNFGPIPVNLTPLKTAVVSSAVADGFFCPEQPNAGCFGAEVGNQMGDGSTCRGIFADGSPFGDLRDGAAHAGVLGSVFCIPMTSSPLVNIAANLPGPGEVTLPGTLKYIATP